VEYGGEGEETTSTRRPELPTIWNSRTTLRDINDLKKKRDTGGKLDKTRRKDPKPRNHQDHFEDHSHSGGKKSDVGKYNFSGHRKRKPRPHEGTLSNSRVRYIYVFLFIKKVK
jgi:hypothetical protein